MCYFFFFQAEDGIRDTSVTGVQTCALPILVSLFFFWDMPGRFRLPVLPVFMAFAGYTVARMAGHRAGPEGATCSVRVARRSEERRVGKEWRSGWARDHYTEK